MKNSRNKLLFESLLDLNTAAAVLGCSVSTITRYCEDGTLAYITTHRGKRKVSRKIRPSTLHAFLAGNTVRATPGGGGGTNLPVPEIHPVVFPVDEDRITDEQIMALLDEAASGTTAAEEASRKQRERSTCANYKEPPRDSIPRGAFH